MLHHLKLELGTVVSHMPWTVGGRLGPSVLQSSQALSYPLQWHTCHFTESLSEVVHRFAPEASGT